MKDNLEVVDMKFVPNGRILDDGINSLKSIINNELKKNLPKNFKIIMRETGSYAPYVYLNSATKKLKHT